MPKNNNAPVVLYEWGESWEDADGDDHDREYRVVVLNPDGDTMYEARLDEANDAMGNPQWTPLAHLSAAVVLGALEAFVEAEPWADDDADDDEGGAE